MVVEYKFNHEQARAFRCICAVILHSLARRYEIPLYQLLKIQESFSCLPQSDTKQLVMGLFGQAGTGKSEIINAVREFVQRWGLPESLCVSATTGVAACLVHGTTCHRAVGLSAFAKKTKTIHKTLAQDWSTVAVMIIDEVSMISSSQLYLLDQYLRQLKGRSDLLFGGVQMVIFLKMTLIALNSPAYDNNHHHYNLTNTLPTPFLYTQVFAGDFYQLQTKPL